MTVRVDCDEQRVNFHIAGDIYEEHAECLRDMVYSHVRRGIKELDIQLYSTYYVSKKGQQCLQGLQDTLRDQGVMISFKNQSGNISSLHDTLI